MDCIVYINTLVYELALLNTNNLILHLLNYILVLLHLI